MIMMMGSFRLSAVPFNSKPSGKKATLSQLINTRSISILPPDMLMLMLNRMNHPPHPLLRLTCFKINSCTLALMHTRTLHTHSYSHSHSNLLQFTSELIRSAISCFILFLSQTQPLSHKISL